MAPRERSQRFSFSTIVVGYLVVFILTIILAGCAGNKQDTLPSTPVRVIHDTVRVVDTTAKVVAEDSTSTIAQFIPGWVLKSLVNVRSAPSTAAPVVRKLSRGTEVMLAEKSGQWWRVQLDGTDSAFVHESMISLDRYVDPWTQFKLGCRLADTSLQIITAVTEIKDAQVPSASLTVGDNWNSFSKVKKQRAAQAAYAYWKVCLQKSGYDPKNSMIVLRDEKGTELARVTGAADKTTVELLGGEGP